MNRSGVVVSSLLIGLLMAGEVLGQEPARIYENRFRVMLDYAVHINEYVRRHIQDRKLAAYARQMAATNAQMAEQMTPSKKYAQMHPHFLLVLENVERSMYYLSKREMSRYRHHQKIVRKELRIVETLAERAGVEPLYYRF